MLTIQELPTYPIWHVVSDNRDELAMAFLRMQKYYECPNPQFQGKIFTLKKYEDWYICTHPNGAFTYATDWSAFNVPGRVVRSVCETFADHSDNEQWLFTELQARGVFNGEFYLIGNKCGEYENFEHEYRHALFALNEKYRNVMSRIIAQYAVPELRSWIYKRYAPNVLIDEIQAHALTGWPKDCAVSCEMRKLKHELMQAEKQYITA